MKILFLAIIICAASIPLHSQEGRSYGFKTGVTISNPDFTVDTNSASVNVTGKAGFVAGIFVDLIKAGFFELSNELYFNRKVCSADASYPGIYQNQIITTSADARVDYLIYGITCKAVFPFGRTSAFVMVEPRINFYLDSKITVTDDTYYDENYVKDCFKKIGYGANLGIGLNIEHVGNHKIFIEGLFCPDFFYAYEDGLGKAKSNSFEIRMGISFF